MKTFLVIAVILFVAFFSLSGVADETPATIEKDGKIEITEKIDKAEYISQCEGRVKFWEDAVEHSQAKLDYWTAELAKYKKK